MQRDLACAALGLVLAVLYWVAATRLPTSFLSDAVGADGVPKVLAVVLAGLSALIGMRAFSRRNEPAEPQRHALALGIAVVGFVYVAAVPYLGYLSGTALLAGAAALYYGAPRRWPVALFALATAALLWLAFGALLGIALP